MKGWKGLSGEAEWPGGGEMSVGAPSESKRKFMGLASGVYCSCEEVARAQRGACASRNAALSAGFSTLAGPHVSSEARKM